MNNITNEQKIYELSKIWKEVAYNFAFWDKVDIDWDEEYRKSLVRVLETTDSYDYYMELSRFVALLGDGHTGVSLPMEMRQDPRYFSMLPVYLWKYGDKITVLTVVEELKNSVPVFSILKKVDGIDIEEYVREKCYPYIWHANEAACGVSEINELMFGKPGTGAVFTFEKDGKQFDITLEREDPSKMAWCKMDFSHRQDDKIRIISSSAVHKVYLTMDNIAVIKMTSFEDDTMCEKIYADFEELKDAVGYIIDVRGNGGGNSSNADAIAALFIKGEFRSCSAETQMYNPVYKAWSVFRDDFKGLSLDEAEKKFADSEDEIMAYRMSRNMYYVTDEAEVVTDNAPGKLNGPIVVLMNEYTISAAEDFIDVMKMYTDAVFVGGNTAGTSGQILCETLESGGSYRICTRRCIAQNGEDIYNKGFAPDIRIPHTVEDLKAGRDRAMEKAMEIIKQNFRFHSDGSVENEINGIL